MKLVDRAVLTNDRRRVKTCFKCNLSLALSEFYRHPRMEDGRLNKCKSCTRSDVAARLAVKKLNPKWLAAERKRGRKKQARIRAAGTDVKKTPATSAKWRKANRQKVRAQKQARRAKLDGIIKEPMHCEKCGREARLEMHHADYSQPLTVTWLCTPCHGVTRHKK